ncbi:MAG: carbon storage regulator [Verrucomicrobiales bacterium]|nr:carbon storage regulator [Verrucomicrobiales bacterium]|tara:strand:- start:1606 stop:1851 length:246 start_codon:yes stop_codon:yes gene_type:complete
MLVLSRKPNESIVIDGRIKVSVLRVDSGDAVRLGVEAPLDIRVMRKEIYDEIMASNQAAAGSAGMARKQASKLKKQLAATP